MPSKVNRHVPAAVILTLIASVLLPIETRGFEAEPADDDSPILTRLSVVLTTIRRDDLSGHKQGEPWPRTESNFAQEKGWALPIDDVVKGLLARLNTDVTVDAYLKWQLLSFVEGFDSLEPRVMFRLMDKAIKPIPRPTGFGQQSWDWSHVAQEELRPTLPNHDEWVADSLRPSSMRRPQVYRPPASLARGYVPTAWKTRHIGPSVTVSREGDNKEYVAYRMTEMLNEAVAETDRKNEVIHACRDALIERMPESDGVRLAMKIRDAAERLHAGDESFYDVVEGLLEMTKSPSISLTPDSAVALIRAIHALGKDRVTIMDRYVPGPNPNSVLGRGRRLVVPQPKIRTLTTRLRDIKQIQRSVEE